MIKLEIPPRFKVRGWLSDEDFQRILEFSKYVGRDRGFSIFELSDEKAKESGLGPVDILRELEELKDSIPQQDLEILREYLRRKGTVKINLNSSSEVVISSELMLKPYLQEYLAQLKYSKELRSYIAKPYLYYDLVKHLNGKGVIVDDKVGLLERARLSRQVKFVGQLRPYQQEALDAWSKNNNRGVIVLPTGAGKTVVAIAAIAAANVKTLIVAYTKEHVKQWSDAIRRFTDAGGLLGAFYGDEKSIGDITVTTYQTAYRYVRQLSPRFALVIFDEAHHLPADKFKAIAEYMLAPYRMGLSATAVREDNKQEEVFPLVGGIVYQKSASELMQEGFLAPYVIRRVTVKLAPEEQKLYDELRKRYASFAMGRTFQEVLEAAKKGEQNAIQALRIRAQMQSIVQESRSKLDKVVDIAKQELNKGSKIIIFTQYKKQAEELAQRLGALLIHGGLEREARDRALDEFKRLKSGVLVVTTVGDEGLDIPDANVGILVSGTGSRRQFIQRLGRLLRPMPGKTAVLYEVVASGTSEVVQSKKRREAVGD
ncbi:DEAD/DEAH box helicase [Acidilobus sp.]|uniref:DEAD/DEAH box helicase n=1 Tax=Acidilobus sp. TaxID=1872109 RepID=UPI003D04DCC9